LEPPPPLYNSLLKCTWMTCILGELEREKRLSTPLTTVTSSIVTSSRGGTLNAHRTHQHHQTPFGRSIPWEVLHIQSGLCSSIRNQMKVLHGGFQETIVDTIFSSDERSFKVERLRETWEQRRYEKILDNSFIFYWYFSLIFFWSMSTVTEQFSSSSFHL